MNALIRALGASSVALLLMSPALPGQTPVHGTVVTETDAPLAGAVILTVRSRRSASTNRLGQFTIWIDSFPDTLRIASIGYRPDTISVERSRGLIRVVLSRALILLSDVIVT